MDLLKKLFSDSGDVSEMRVMSMLALLVGSALAFIGIGKPQIDYSGLTMLVGAFIGAAFTGKVMQKRVEQDGKKTVTTEESNGQN